jgi:UDP-glucose 4-epimerase
MGAENIIRAVRENKLSVKTVIGVSTDKACKPVNVMGMTKAIQERLYVRANLDCEDCKFVAVRYGNVLASRGSVVPLFREQIATGGPVTVTTPHMTRFLLGLDRAVDTVFEALQYGERGEIFIPKCPAAKILDLAEVLVGDQKIEIVITGIRPGEKLHESLISAEEGYRTVARREYFVILPMLPELQSSIHEPYVFAGREYDSQCDLMNKTQLHSLLKSYELLLDDSSRARLKQSLAK